MKRCLWLTVLLLSVCLMPLRGDEFEDLIQECARVSRNYNRALSAPNTRLDKEFRSCLDNMKRQSVVVQRVIRKLELGKDFNFPQLTEELERIYLEAQRNGKVPSGSKIDSHSVSPEGLLRILTSDVMALRKMGFTTEDGGSIKSSMETRRKLAEYQRLVDFFRRHYTAARSNRQRKDVSLERFFDFRMQRMMILATQLMQIAKTKYPNSQSRYNLQTETSQMLKCFSEWRDLPAPSTKNRKNGKSQHRKRTLSTDTNSPAALRAEIDLSLRNISAQLILWEHSGFQSDDPIRKNDRAAAGREDPADVLRQPTKTTEYSSLDQKTLNDMLNKRRLAVIRSNSSMDGFDHDAERMFLLSLSRDQKRVYQSYLRDYQQQGYTQGTAVRNAVMKIYTQLQLEKPQLSVQELIRLLEAMDKEEARRQEKNNVQFKLERGESSRN